MAQSPSTVTVPGPSSSFSPGKFDPWILPLIACFFLLLVLTVHPINDSDLGLHLRSGQWILQNHRVPTLDSFTTSSSDRPYLDLEWLYQSFLYLGYRLGGYGFLSLAHAALILLAFILLWVRLRSVGAPPWISLPLFLSAILASEIRFRARPETLTWVLLSFLFWILESRSRRSRDLLFLLPLLMVAWVNTEGLFFIGLIVLAVHAIPSLSRTPPNDAKLLRYSGLAVLACLLNPYFFQGFLFPFSFLSSLGSSEVLRSSAQEFRSPWSWSQAGASLPPLFLLAYGSFSLFFGGILLATAKRRKIQEWLLASFFFLLSFSAIRNIPLFMLACLPLAASFWREITWPWGHAFGSRFLSKPLAAWIATFLILGLSLRVLTGAYYIGERRTERFGVGLDRQDLPAEACDFLRQNHLEGRILNSLDTGGWLDWQAPQKTFLDGRLDVMGPGSIQEYAQSQAPGGLGILLVKYRPDLLFFNPTLVPQWTLDLQRSPDWRQVHLDPAATLYLRKGYREDIPDLDIDRLVADQGISPSLLQDADRLLQLAPPEPLPAFLEGFTQVQVFPNDLQNLGIACGYSGHPEAAELLFLESIRRSRGKYHDFYYNLGLVYYYAQRPDRSALCMRRVLRQRPGDPVARQLAGDRSF